MSLSPAVVAPASNPALPSRLHHLATVIRDQNVTRAYMEDVLGLPLVATWCEKAYLKDLGAWHEYCHTFYGLDDGSALAFFQFADPTMFERCQPKVPAEVRRFGHVAIRVSPARQAELLERMQRHAAPHRQVDHGYCQSLYTTTPDGLDIEFTVDAPDSAPLWEARRVNPRAELARWMSGDHTVNNDHR